MEQVQPSIDHCEHCGKQVVEENIQRVCAYQTEESECVSDYTNSIFCTCCDKCRSDCNNAALDNQQKQSI